MTDGLQRIFRVSLNLATSRIVSLTLKLVRNMKAKTECSTYPSIMAIQLYMLPSTGAAVTPLICSWTLSMASWISLKSRKSLFWAWLGASDIFLFTLGELRIAVHDQRPCSIYKFTRHRNFSAYACHLFLIRTRDFGEIHSEITHLRRMSRKSMVRHQN